MNNKDTYHIICSFLNPLELVSTRVLSKLHNMWTNIYIIKTMNTLNIEEYICPKCANWIDNEGRNDISDYNEFVDYFLTDNIKIARFRSVEEWFNKKYIFDVSRKKILCYDCELEEDYNDNIFKNFRYKGNRIYTLLYFYGIHSWCSICLIKDDKGYWNEYRKVLSVCMDNYNEEISSYDIYDWNNNSDDEDYDNQYDLYI